MKTLRLAGLALAALAVQAAAAQADPTFQIYYDEAAFLAAAGTVRTEDFNDAVLTPGLGLTTTHGVISGGLFNDQFPGRTGVTAFTFTHLASAFGGTFNETPGGAGLVFEVTQWPWSAQTIGFVPHGSFFGFISDYAFTEVDLVAGFKPFATNEIYTLDNLRFNIVPEPATWALMLTGFATLGSVLRRRRAAAA